MTALGLHCFVGVFFSGGEQGLLLAVVHELPIAVASLVVEHRLCRAHGLQKLCHVGLVAPRHVESSWTRDQTHVLCTGWRILILCATREVL